MEEVEESFLHKIYSTSPHRLRGSKINELIRVYQDLEKTLRGLKDTAGKSAESSLRQINVRKLIVQLSRSKRRLERKIGNTLLLEKQHLKKRIRNIASNLSRET
jgi:hypothetical protein